MVSDVVPGSGEVGLVAMSGPDAAWLLQGRRQVGGDVCIVEGVRYTIPGDWATVDADGNVRLLGRGS